MRPAFLAGVLSLFAATCIAAEPRWIRIESPNFEIYSTASEASTRDTLKQFEQVRAFFLTVMPIKDVKPLPVRIVQFNSEKEYQPYRLNPVAKAYYKPGAERDMIVMSHGGAENMPVSIHEYTHLFMRHAGFNLPPWLNEGMAEVYSTLQQTGNKVTVGHPLAGRLLEMQQNKWIPLSTILSVGLNSPYYNEQSKAGGFYDESWALTHMLGLSEDYRPKWRDALKEIIAGKDSAEVLTSVYGKPIAAIEKDLKSYLQSTSFSAGVFDAKLENIKEKYTAEPAPPFDVKLMLLDIAAGSTPEQTQKQLEQLAAEQPARPEPYVQMGYLEWGFGKPATDQVRELFAKAYALGGRSPRMLWDYGRMITPTKPADAVSVLTELSDLEPDRRDVKIELASAMLNAGRPDNAINTLLSLHGCTPAEASQCMGVASYAYYRMNDKEKAQTAADQYLKYAKTPQDRQSAQRLLDALNRPTAPVPAAVLQAQAPAADSGPEAAPRLVHRPQPGDPGSIQSPPIRLAGVTIVKGNFVEFLCTGGKKQVVLETASGRQRFLMDDPQKILFLGVKDDQINLYCGEQKPAHAVELGYVAAPDGSGADGLVRSLDYTQ